MAIVHKVLHNKRILWQISFILLGSSWLLGPALNHLLSPRTALISEYEMPGKPFSWLFRISDILAALLLLWAVGYMVKKQQKPKNFIYSWLAAISILMLIDPIATASCVQVASKCITESTMSNYIHGVESILVAVIIFGLSAYDALHRKVLVSTYFMAFQLTFGILLITNVVSHYNYAALGQFTYQFITIIWLAWFVMSMQPQTVIRTERFQQYARLVFAVWTYLNGIFAIIISLSHIHLLGFLRNVYFANNTAWLAQYGVLVGISMLYVSRHLTRGEYRARQLVLIVLFFEVIKYSVIAPDVDLLALYAITFVTLFACRQYFMRGSVRLSRNARLQEAGILLTGVLVALGLVITVLLRDHHHAQIALHSLDHFEDFVLYHDQAPRHLVRSSLLAHTAAALLVGTVLFVLWSLFRPIKVVPETAGYAERQRARKLLEQVGQSSEDYFKVLSAGQEYFWSADRRSFIAYKVSKSVVFALADPVGPSYKKRVELLQSFTAYWHAHGYRVCFLLIPEQSLALYQASNLNTMQIGANAIVDVQAFASKTIKSKWWRWQTNRGTKAGYRYQSAQAPHPVALLQQTQRISDAWLARPAHREQGFTLGSYRPSYLQECTIHYITDQNGHMVAFANELPIFNHGIQTTVDLMRFLPDYNNAMPFLLANLIIDASQEQHFSKFDLGFVPLATMENRLATAVKFVGSKRFSSSGLAQFKNKFEPSWHNCYIAYDGDITDLASIALAMEEVIKPFDETAYS
ncbi:MAG: hypothetical protein JWM81_371 [Candidatus Saccharibacteria bacterium]|nr:hypothetical protein [Candidatus Saccharibacteria bacterium]